MKLIALVLCNALLLSQQATAAKQTTSTPAKPVDFMGITLGQPFDMPECEFEQRTFKTYSLASQPVTPCWQHYDIGRDPGDPLDTAGSFKISFTTDYSKIPDGIVPSTLSFIIVEGSIEGIYAGTGGLKSQNSILEKLTDKYGKPTKQSSDAVQNLAGATLSNITAEWALPNKTTAVFIGMVGTIDRGYISVVSANGLKYLEREAQKKKAEAPSF